MNHAYLAEFLGTFFLVFAGCGAIVINAKTKGAVSHVGVALTFGLVVMAMVYAFGDVSGAHINPSVTLAMAYLGKLPLGTVLPYIACQVGGALVASLLLRVMFPDDTTSLGATLPNGAVWRSFVLEVILTAALLLVIFGVTSGAEIRGYLAGIAVGGLIALEALFAGPICGASMNPARSLAPAIVSGNVKHLWVYITAPILGAIAAAALLPLVSPEKPTQEKSVAADPNKIRVLFVCIENSNRSQMAEAFARMYGGDRVEAFSCGSRPSGRVNPKAIAAMKELGYDLTQHSSKPVEEFNDQPFDAAVTMGCGDACPLVHARRRVDWSIPDPKELSPEQFNEVRDLIGQKVRALLEELEREST